MQVYELEINDPVIMRFINQNQKEIDFGVGSVCGDPILLQQHIIDATVIHALYLDERVEWLEDRNAEYHIHVTDANNDEYVVVDLYIHDDNVAMRWKLTFGGV